MATLAEIKVERDDDELGRQDDELAKRNGKMRESSSKSSLVASIPARRPEMAEGVGETAPVDILQEASRISSEVTRLVGELALCKVKCSEQNKELEKCREKIDIQNEELQQAEDLISNLQTQVEELEGTRREDGEVDRVDLKEMKAMVATERAEKMALQTKFDKLKRSMEQFNQEFICVVSKVKEFSAEKSDGEEDDYENVPRQENKLEGVMEYAKNKFQLWAANQEKLKSELKSMTQVVQSLAGVLEIKEDEVKSPPRRSSRKIVTSSPPELPVMKISPKTAVAPPPQSPLVLSDMKIIPKTPVAPRAHFETEGVPLQNRQKRRTQRKGRDTEWEDVPETVPIITKVASTTKKFKLNHGYCPTNLLGCLCGRKFLHKYHLRKHLRYFTTDRKFVCDCCPKRFLNASYLRKHQRSAHKIVSLKTTETGCRKCGGLFPTKDSFQKHRKDCSGRGGAVNSHPDQIEPEMNDKYDDDEQKEEVNFSGKRHGMNIAHRHQGFYCICGDKFISRRRLDAHIEFFNRGRPIYREVESDNEEEDDSQLEEPELDHSQYEDFEVEQFEEDSGQLDIPEQNEPQPSTSKASATHAPHPSRVNECLCGYKGSNRANLGKHIQYYTLEKVFKCDYCSHGYNEVSLLRDHILRLHKNVTKEQVNRMRTGCRSCGQMFPGMKALRGHFEAEHSGTDTGTSSAPDGMSRKRPHSMPEPSSEKRQHVPGKMFTCPHCDDIGYPILNRLNKHMKIVHGITSELVIGCSDCGMGFSERKFHSQHRIAVHGSAIGKPKQIQLAMKKANSSMPLENPTDQFEFDQEEKMEGMKEVVQDNGQTAYVGDELCPIPIPITVEEDDDPEGCMDSYWDMPLLKAEVTQDPPEDPLQTAGPQLVGESREGHRADFSQAGLHIKQQQSGQLKFPCHLCSLGFMFPSVLNRHLVRTHKINQTTPKAGPSSRPAVGNDLPRHGNDVSKATEGSQEMSPRRKVTVAHPATSGWTRKTTAGKKATFGNLWCKPCGKNFKDRAQRYQHMKAYHPEKLGKVGKPEGPSRVMWRITQKQTSLGLMPTHMDVTVEGGRPTCLCRREYLSTNGLAKHIREENRGRIFKCNWCPKGFYRNTTLMQHCQKFHNKVILEGAKVCGVCNQICESLSELAKHKSEAHYL